MAGRFVRASKYRHVFGRPTKREQCYDNLHLSKNAWDTNLIKANPKYLAVNWESGGGGAFAVIPLEETGKLPERLPLFRGHTAAVLDTDWNPFNDEIIASASDDGKVFLWQVPDNYTLHTDGEEANDVKPVGKLSGHSRKVGHVLFNPAAENVLASSSGDLTVRLWDLEDGKSKLSLKHADVVQALSWNGDGSMLVTTSRDKKIRFWDVRQEKPAYEVAGHTGAKNSRCVWMGDLDRVVTTGFSKMSERQIGLWDTRNPTQAISIEPLDSSSGVGMPFWDDGCKMLYIAGKGDGNIKYFEFENDKFEPLSEYRSPDPQRGLAFMPKRGVNTHENEIMRAFKSVNDQYIEPISFIVPRRAETFQDDIYPPTAGLKAGVDSTEWFSGKTVSPPKYSMEAMYDGAAPQEVQAAKPSATRSAPQPAPASVPASPAKQAAPEPKPEPTSAPAPIAREVPSLKDNKSSMSAMANKFADKDDREEEDDDASSFEEVQKPVERPHQRAESKPSVNTAVKSTESSLAGDSTATPSSHSKSASELRQQGPKEDSPQPSVAAAAGGLRDVLHEIREMLQSQSRQIEQLTNEVAQLKAKVGN